MYKGLHKARRVKPKGSYKRRKRGTMRTARGNQFANQLGGLLKNVPTKGASTMACHWEGFTDTSRLSINADSNALSVLSFSLDQSSTLKNAANVFQRYKITEATCLVWPLNLPQGDIPGNQTNQFIQVSASLAPFKQQANVGVRNGSGDSIGAIQGAQFKVLNTTQDVLRCRIFGPRPAIMAATGNDAQTTASFMPTGTLACNSAGISIPHFGFILGFNDFFPHGPKDSGGSPPPNPDLNHGIFGFKMCLGVTFYRPKLNTVTAVDLDDQCPLIVHPSDPLIIEGSVEKDVLLAEAVDTLTKV